MRSGIGKAVRVAVAAGMLAGARGFAAEEREGDRLPDSVRGFSGMVRGVVVEKGEGNTFLFKVGRVLRVWEGNKASDPQALVGQIVRVGPNWRKNDRGKWHPVERHVAFARKVDAGQEMNLEIRNAERDAFVILELSREQAELDETER
ncbi:MAG: hypothetical protein JXR37_16080 [Kiritimatiellae bacterium]|nr:hypothetical protein [Kiritimatiellia bacterium]